MILKTQIKKICAITGLIGLGCLMSILMLQIMTSGPASAKLYADASFCNSSQGKVISVANDEEFIIEVCRDNITFKEFSYCFNVEPGDAVVFDWSPIGCEVVSFTVQRNGVQCGVLCP